VTSQGRLTIPKPTLIPATCDFRSDFSDVCFAECPVSDRMVGDDGVDDDPVFSLELLEDAYRTTPAHATHKILATLGAL
jgi:hypothetical protein